MFGEQTWIASVGAVAALNAFEGRPWADWNRGKGLTPNSLARLLKPFGITPDVITTTADGKEWQVRGYKQEAFKAPWAAYVQSEPSDRQEPSNDATNPPSGNRQPDPDLTVDDSPDNPHGDSLPDTLTVENAEGPGVLLNVPPPEGGEPDPECLFDKSLEDPAV